MKDETILSIVNPTKYTNVSNLRGRADKLFLHLNRKWMEKDILIQLKKKYACINYFQSCINIFLQNHQALQYISANAALVFEIRSSNNWCFIFETISSLHTSPYPASYCTHINTLITINHFLTADFTLPTVLLYSHQHTDHHKQLLISVGGSFSAVKNSIAARCLNRTSENSSISMCTGWGL